MTKPYGQYNILIEEFSSDKSLKDAATRFLQERRQRSGGEENEPVQKPESAPAVEEIVEKPHEIVAEQQPETVGTAVEAEPVGMTEEVVPEPSIQIKTVGRIRMPERCWKI